jgi:carboxyl-terminal processing protease
MRLPRLPVTGIWLAASLILLAPGALSAQQSGQAAPAPSGTAPAAPVITLSVADVVKDFDSAWQTIKDTFVDPKTYGVDWDKLKADYRPKVAAASDAQAAYKLVDEMIGKLKSPNTGVIAPWDKPAAAPAADALAEPLLQYGGAGILLQPLKSGDVFVLQVFKDTPAEKAGVLVGDVITGVDSWRVTGADAMDQVTQRVRGVVGTKVTLTLRDPAGVERNVDILRAQIDLRPSVDSKIIQGTIGYIRLPVLSKDLVDEASKALPSLLSTNGLILDLRSVGSGNLDQMFVVAQWFLGATHMGGFVSRQGAEALPFNQDSNAAYTRPMVVLTNSRTYGIGEMLAFLLRQYKRAGIVGETTAGSFEIADEVNLPSGGLLDVAVARYVTGQGATLPLEGLTPDVKVDPPDLATLRSGKDVVIDKAVDTLRSSPRWQ